MLTKISEHPHCNAINRWVESIHFDCIVIIYETGWENKIFLNEVNHLIHLTHQSVVGPAWVTKFLAHQKVSQVELTRFLAQSE